jgi:hypothetical protein
MLGHFLTTAIVLFLSQAMQFIIRPEWSSNLKRNEKEPNKEE